jgi:hypothetical protein
VSHATGSEPAPPATTSRTAPTAAYVAVGAGHAEEERLDESGRAARARLPPRRSPLPQHLVEAVSIG